MSLELDSTSSRFPPPLVCATYLDNMFTESHVSNVEEGNILNYKNLCDGLLASLKTKEASNRRFEAAAWVKSMVGSLDILCEPYEDDFFLCLRYGIILCDLLNKIQPGAVSKFVVNHVEEGWPLASYQ